MRSLIIVAIVTVVTSCVSAAEKITVAQLDQILATYADSPQPTKHNVLSPEEIPDLPGSDLLHQRNDDEEAVGRQIAALDLSERLSTTTMFGLIWKYHLGAPVQLALEELSDRTALLNLPPSEEPNLPPPNPATQQSMLRASQSWVTSELLHLPNFIATQTTTRFDDVPPPLKYWKDMLGPGLHRVDIVQRQISFRDGREVTDDSRSPADKKAHFRMLESHGEFGTEAAVVLMDIQKGTVAFSHWEQTMAGLAAVYRYAVPGESSHYEVIDECRDHGSFRDTPGYHGTLAVDPQTGAIFRMTLEADSNAEDPVSHVASVIEYGPVVLGRHRSICPLRSLVFMVEETTGCGHGSRKLQKPISMINQTIFSNYHRFGSSSTIIFSQAENGATSAPRDVPSRSRNSLESRTPMQPSITGQNKRP